LRRRYLTYGKIHRSQIHNAFFYTLIYTIIAFDRPSFSPYYGAPMTDAEDLVNSASPAQALTCSLPIYVDIRKVFDLGVVIEGKISLDRLPRFSECLANCSGEVSGKLEFLVTETGNRVILGSVSASVEVVCQRCLEPLELELSDEIQLALIESESQIYSLEARWDPWLINGPKITVAGLIEEQLILCMPLVSYHPNDRCIESLEYKQVTERRSAESKPGVVRNPFKVLSALKKDDTTR